MAVHRSLGLSVHDRMYYCRLVAPVDISPSLDHVMGRWRRSDPSPRYPQPYSYRYIATPWYGICETHRMLLKRDALLTLWLYCRRRGSTGRALSFHFISHPSPSGPCFIQTWVDWNCDLVIHTESPLGPSAWTL
jgi:hypothetical protein